MPEITKISNKPETFQAFKWENNEADLRAFMNDDSSLSVRDRGIQIWNRQTTTWVSCPIHYYVIKDKRNDFDVISPLEFEHDYETSLNIPSE